ncbi:MAG: hypothetical protein JWR40_91 [Massilia sp.]|jgi:hypothetical protein|nr:hypothetical protein [Massilia sp.]
MPTSWLKDNDMARKAFFCFRYRPDYWRAITVRNSWTSNERTVAGFFESTEWEGVKRQADSVIQAWIDEQLRDTTVSVVLIGQHTARSKWIAYEINASQAQGNGMLGIYVHKIKDSKGVTTARGANPFDVLAQASAGAPAYPVYDWFADDGYNHLDDWIEAAAKAAGK